MVFNDIVDSGSSNVFEYVDMCMGRHIVLLSSAADPVSLLTFTRWRRGRMITKWCNNDQKGNSSKRPKPCDPIRLIWMNVKRMFLVFQYSRYWISS